jgi:hypothetical protein
VVFHIHFSGKKGKEKNYVEENSYYTLTQRKKKNKKTFSGNISTDSNEEREKVELRRRRTESNR